ncbi:MAG: hypothetical protein AB1489_33370 [Acidobacteriota bacterium]
MKTKRSFKPLFKLKKQVAVSLISIVAITFLCASTHAADGEVFVLGTLYKKHETVAVYDLPTLRKTILAIKPDVLVLDVTPTELKEEKVFPSKIEYTGVVFPLMKEGKYRVYAAEPAEPMFSELSQSASKLYKAMLEKPDAAMTMKRYQESTYETLKAIWQSPADVNSAVTDRILAGMKTLEGKLVGPAFVEGQKQWDQHMVSVVLRAVQENRGKRVLMLVGIENCHQIRDELRHNPTINLVDTEQWLRANTQ